MQTLKIEIPSGYEIDSLDKLSGEIKFKEKPRSVFDRIKTIDDVLADNHLTREQFYKTCYGLERDEVAYRILKLVAKSLNEGWLPDWSDSDEYKYFPWFEMRGSSGFRFLDGVLAYGFERRLSPLLQNKQARRARGEALLKRVRRLHGNQITHNCNARIKEIENVR